MILHDDVTRLARVRVAEMRFEPALPIRVPERNGARRQDELARHEEVVGDGVGGEVGQIAQPEGAERIAGREVQELAPSDPLRAFRLGYLSHLAAPPLAHNKSEKHTSELQSPMYIERSR